MPGIKRRRFCNGTRVRYIFYQFRLWTDSAPWAAGTLNGMLAQATAIGLTAPHRFAVADPITLVPVMAVGLPMKNASVANTRMRAVDGALARHGVELHELEVWAADGDDIRNVGLGALPEAPNMRRPVA